jgi:hypothetical protein
MPRDERRAGEKRNERVRQRCRSLEFLEDPSTIRGASQVVGWSFIICTRKTSESDVHSTQKILRAELNLHASGLLSPVDRSGHASPEQVVDGNLPWGGTDRGRQRRTLGLLS